MSEKPFSGLMGAAWRYGPCCCPENMLRSVRAVQSEPDKAGGRSPCWSMYNSTCPRTACNELRRLLRLASPLALENLGITIAARMPRSSTTTRISTSVKPRLLLVLRPMFVPSGGYRFRGERSEAPQRSNLPVPSIGRSRLAQCLRGSQYHRTQWMYDMPPRWANREISLVLRVGAITSSTAGQVVAVR